jgi:hypothetical protein
MKKEKKNKKECGNSSQKNTKRRNYQAKGLSSNNLKNIVKHLIILSLLYKQLINYRHTFSCI